MRPDNFVIPNQPRQGPATRLVGGLLLALAAGWWGLRGVLRVPVAQTLRRAAD